MDGPEGKPKQTKMLNQEEPDKTRVKKGNGSKHGKNPSGGQLKQEEEQLPLPLEETSRTIIDTPNPPNFWCTNRDCPYEHAGNPAESADNPPAATYDNNPRSVV